jgi:UDP-N-acetylglucosamine--N-acetylmuramyl-(pentapeptide) pyrophosphoryl-undecaprenol N-acetylglucosamine transferase
MTNDLVIMTGGGSGGHLTPIVSVAEELKKLRPNTKIIYVGQSGDALGDVMRDNPIFDGVHTVRAGKLRRYHGEGWKQLLDLRTLLLNLRDMAYVVVGFFQAATLIRRLKPRTVFCKGGFVSVPVGLAAALLRCPYITHDSDSLPGLANRIIAPWARLHAVSLPKEIYRYPQAKTITVGVPINRKLYKPVTKEMRLVARASLNIPQGAKVLFVTGGGLGALRLNRAVTEGAKQLFSQVPHLYILHQAGRKDEEKTRELYTAKLPAENAARVQVFGFTDAMATMGEAADVVITRAGATNMAEMALQGKACIVVPNPQLTGGHQLKNASVYYKAEAAVVLLESDFAKLPKVAADLLNDSKRQKLLGEHLQAFAAPKAAQSLAQLIATMVEGH